MLAKASPVVKTHKNKRLKCNVTMMFTELLTNRDWGSRHTKNRSKELAMREGEESRGIVVTLV
jgi:hypothetical protein